jgi:hypothetical protein
MSEDNVSQRNSDRKKPSLITPLEPLMNEFAYCDITGESPATARKNRLLGKGCPYVKLGSLVKYRPEDVRAYIAQNLRTPTSSLVKTG